MSSRACDDVCSRVFRCAPTSDTLLQYSASIRARPVPPRPNLTMPLFRRVLAAVLTGVTAVSLAAQTKPLIQITADFRDASRKLFHADVDLPAQAGVLDLTTPKWIPGNHRPTGPVDDIVGVVFTANGQPLKWRRDDVDLYEFHVEVPKGVTSIHAHLDCIATSRITQNMAVLEWEKLLLYPAHMPVRNIPIQPTVIVPEGWGIGTALTPLDPAYTPEPAHGGTVKYAATNVEQLQDSPVITGRYFHEFALAPDVSPKHFIDVVADDPADAQLRPAVLTSLNRLVKETGAAYASRHYLAYHFLLTLSDIAGGEGLEHGQSSDNGVGEKGFADDAHQLGEADLLSHEFTHSWNGKYRRPARLYQDDFQKPEQGDLLWVYEGMTQYMGNVLAARSGLKSQAQYRDLLALSAADLDYKPGREWRSTEDTAIAASILRGGNPAWANWKRGQDYYQEGELLWLDVDTTIRKMTDNKKSITDFHHIFLGKGGNTGPEIVPYEFNDIVHDLKEVVPYDWAAFLHDRVVNINPKVNLAGIERGGYRLVYTDKPTESANTLAAVFSRRGGGVNVWYSLGLRLGLDGTIADVRWNGPSDKARLAPGYKLIAINGQVYSPDILRAAIRQAKGSSTPIHLLVQADEAITQFDIDYHDGERFPMLQRIDGTTAYLDDITAPLTPVPNTTPTTNK